MRLRRKPAPEKVRDVVKATWGDEVVRMRKTMSRALTCLYAGQVDEAQRILSRGLAEGWWK